MPPRAVSRIAISTARVAQHEPRALGAAEVAALHHAIADDHAVARRDPAHQPRARAPCAPTSRVVVGLAVRARHDARSARRRLGPSRSRPAAAELACAGSRSCRAPHERDRLVVDEDRAIVRPRGGDELGQSRHARGLDRGQRRLFSARASAHLGAPPTRSRSRQRHEHVDRPRHEQRRAAAVRPHVELARPDARDRRARHAAIAASRVLAVVERHVDHGARLARVRGSSRSSAASRATRIERVSPRSRGPAARRASSTITCRPASSSCSSRSPRAPARAPLPPAPPRRRGSARTPPPPRCGSR